MTKGELFGDHLFSDSARELKKLRVITMCGMMAALAIALNYIASINVGQYIRIGFSTLPNQIVGYLFGPVVGGIFGGLLDVLKWILKPSGAYFPGFTISAVLGGILYGIFLYKRPPRLLNVFLAQLCVKLFVNLVLNTLWLKIMYEQAILAILPGRIISNAVMLPIDTILLFAVLKVVHPLLRPIFDRDEALKKED